MVRRHSTATLMGLTKKELVEYVRIAEHNQEVAEEASSQQAENVKEMSVAMKWLRKRKRHGGMTMPDVKEKLVELLDEIHHKQMGATYQERIGTIADHLIANGVTIQRWIPVAERLPDHFGVFIVAISEPGRMRVGKDCADFDPFAKTWLPSMCWDKGYKVTHWMPLPEPAKGE